MGKCDHTEILFWSIAFPGFGQFLNGKIVKGITFLIMEFMINVQSNMNQAIVSSFNGDIQTAISVADYQWLLFYPCVYLFAMWDAYRDAGGGKVPFSFLPFVCSAYVGTIGVVYSPNFKIMGILVGPIWLGIIGLVVGASVGILIQQALIKRKTPLSSME